MVEANPPALAALGGDVQEVGQVLLGAPDAVAEGLMEAVNEVQGAVPVIAVMRGRTPYEKRARELLSNSGIRLCSSVEAGVKEAIGISRG